MSYPLGSNVHSVLLDNGMEATTSPVFVVMLLPDGELVTREFSDYRDAQNAVSEYGAYSEARILAVVEGETNAEYGIDTVWVRR